LSNLLVERSDDTGSITACYVGGIRVDAVDQELDVCGQMTLSLAFKIKWNHETGIELTGVRRLPA
jgi:hypothetical protein